MSAPVEGADGVAIVGMAGRFPGARDVTELWDLVASGRSALTRRTREELIEAGAPVHLIDGDGFVGVAGTIDEFDCFDAAFFGIGPRDAAVMDPQHRVFLECCWEALESAGYAPEGFRGAIGVFGGCGFDGYLSNNLLSDAALVDSMGMFALRHTGNDKDFLCTGVSYRLGLDGPSVSVQTACSTSLVAVHLAAQSLLSGECDLALAGGVSIEVPHGVGYRWREGEVLSRSGVCRAFDERSDGTVLASGAAVVALRRLADALQAGDSILAIVRGSAINNDGARKVGYFAPSVDGHASVVAEALSMAGVTPDTVSMLEAHGTGTALGDAVEVAALTQAFRSETAERQYCRLGSIKPTIGHLDTAAGAASLIKVVQALRHRALPPMAAHTGPNPLLNLEDSPFVISGERTTWDTAGPRRAGVSSLGIGGTNAHVIVEEAPPVPPDDAPSPAQLIVLSARSAPALDEAAARLGAHLEREGPSANVSDTAYTLQVGRRAFPYRRALVAHDRVDLAAALSAPFTPPSPVGPEALPIVFMFPGGGAPYVGVAGALARRFPAFRVRLEELVDCGHAAGLDFLGSVLLEDRDVDTVFLERPTVSLPATACISIALADLWAALGVTPTAVIGHSLGELVGACVSGVLSWKDAVRLVARRGELIERASQGGAMLVVNAPVEQVEPLLPAGASIAAINGPESCVVSGAASPLAGLEDQLNRRSTEHRRLNLSAAAHSPLLDPVLDDYRAAFADVILSPPTVPFVSNVTGDWAGHEVTGPAYWARQLREPVQFARGLATVTAGLPCTLLEVGPGQTLTALARHNGKGKDAVPSVGHPADPTPAEESLLAAVGKLWARGVDIEWPRLHDQQKRRRTFLPTYPFERQRHWIERRADTQERATDVGEWVSEREWSEAPPLPAPPELQTLRWLVVGDAAPAAELVTRLRACAASVDEVPSTADHDQLLERLASAGRWPDRILCCPGDSFAAAFSMASALAKAAPAAGADLSVIVDHAFGPYDPALLAPAHILGAGPALVLPAETGSVTSRVLDVTPVDPGSIDRALAEAAAAQSAGMVSLGRGRHVPVWRSRPLPPPDGGSGEPETWLVTGGLGGIGLTLAKRLARARGARLVLVGRHNARPGSDEAVALEELRNEGVEVTVRTADVQDPQALGAALDGTGPIHGVVHAAGVLDDALLATADLARADAVLGPKVRGIEALAKVLHDHPVRTLALCSSVSADLAVAGQAAYVSANLFLDAYAASHSRPDRRVVAIGWGPWRGVGMTAPLRAAPEAASRVPTTHPSLAWSADVEGGVELWGDLSTEDWLLDQHRMADGRAVLPGTASLEFLAAVAGPRTTLEAVSFQLPIEVAAGERRRVRARAASSAGQRMVTLEYWDGAGWVVSASATVRDAPPPPAAQPLTRPASSSRDVLAAQRRHLRLGPRWDRPAVVSTGAGRTHAEIDDGGASTVCGGMAWDPALLDVALAAGLTASPCYDPELLYVPVSYGSFTAFAPVSGHVSVVASERPGCRREQLTFDVTVAAPDGRVLAIAEAYTMRGLAGGIPSAAPRPRGASPLLTLAASKGILPDQGADAFERIVASPVQGAVVVSPVGFAELRAATGRVEDSGPRVARPALTTAFTAASDSIEEWLVAAWAGLLGVDAVGVDDDFFELGGQSLLAARLFARVQREFGVVMPLSSLYTAPTVRSLAAALRERHETPPTWQCLVGIRTGGTRPPVFVVHGRAGNVLNFRDLALRLGGDQPFYALQAHGLDGGAPDPTIEAMAARYLDEVRSVQQEGPYRLVGYSGGGIVAIEMARALRGAGQDVALLALIDTFAPDLRARTRREQWEGRMRRLRRLGLGYATRWCNERARSLGRTLVGRPAPTATVEGLIDMTPAFDAALARYKLQPYDGDAVVFRAAVDDYDIHPPDLGWRSWVTGRLEVVRVAGDHQSMTCEPAVGVLCDELGRRLDGIVSAGP